MVPTQKGGLWRKRQFAANQNGEFPFKVTLSLKIKSWPFQGVRFINAVTGVYKTYITHIRSKGTSFKHITCCPALCEIVRVGRNKQFHSIVSLSGLLSVAYGSLLRYYSDVYHKFVFSIYIFSLKSLGLLMSGRQPAPNKHMFLYLILTLLKWVLSIKRICEPQAKFHSTYKRNSTEHSSYFERAFVSAPVTMFIITIYNAL